MSIAYDVALCGWVEKTSQKEHAYHVITKHMRQPEVEPGAQSMGGFYVTATLLALLHRNGLRRTRRDCVIFPLL